jgi:hypothetical protein
MGSPRQRADSSKLYVYAAVWDAGLGAVAMDTREALDVTTLENPVDTIGVTAHGIEIYPQLPSPFYNAYMPIRYAENSMVISPADSSAFLVNLCLYPGKFSVTGYYNLSAGREMYINYGLKPAAAAAADNAYEMVISMSALNFLMRKGDKIHLRYAT